MRSLCCFRNNQENLETIKAATVAALEIAENLLDGFPIPGAKVSIGLVLRVIDDLEVCGTVPVTCSARC